MTTAIALGDRRLRICCAGAGAISLFHFTGWKQTDNVEVVAVCDPVREKAEGRAKEFGIVRVYTDCGLIGLGEATISALWSGETQAGTVAAICDYIAPAIVGQDPRDITSIRRAMDFMIKLNPFTKAAVEMAMWDIAGKAVGLPVYQLLGGKVRDSVRIKLVIWARDLAGSRAMAEQQAGHGEPGRRDLAVEIAGIGHVGDVAVVPMGHARRILARIGACAVR
jgi:L-alanine-DL-glutamate epimerase-like enolase superfamily enzyme